jgi:hypothetical protein
MSSLGRALMVFGAILFLAGVALALSPRIPFLGRLPGDFLWKKGSFTFYFPLATCLLLSLLLTLVLSLLRR